MDILCDLFFWVTGVNSIHLKIIVVYVLVQLKEVMKSRSKLGEKYVFSATITLYLTQP